MVDRERIERAVLLRMEQREALAALDLAQDGTTSECTGRVRLRVIRRGGERDIDTMMRMRECVALRSRERAYLAEEVVRLVKVCRRHDAGGSDPHDVALQWTELECVRDLDRSQPGPIEAADVLDDRTADAFVQRLLHVVVRAIAFLGTVLMQQSQELLERELLSSGGARVRVVALILLLLLLAMVLVLVLMMTWHRMSETTLTNDMAYLIVVSKVQVVLAGVDIEHIGIAQVRGQELLVPSVSHPTQQR